MNLKNLKNLKQGMRDLTPLQLCNGRISGLVGMLVGMGCIFIGNILAKSWGWAAFIAFLFWYQLVLLIGELKQKDALIQSEKEIKDLEELNFDEKIAEAKKNLGVEEDEQESSS